MAIKRKAKKRIPLYLDEGGERVAQAIKRGLCGSVPKKDIPLYTDEETERVAQALKGGLWGEELTKEIVPPFSGDLFGEDIAGATFGGSLSTSKEARRGSFSVRTGKRKPTERESRQKRNTGLWETLYPTPKKTVGKEEY